MCAIELKYGNPAGVLGAAYAAGRNRAAEKQRKAGQRLYEQQQAMQYDMARRKQQQDFYREEADVRYGRQLDLRDNERTFQAGQRLLDRQAMEDRQEAAFQHSDAASGVAFDRQRQLEQERYGAMEDMQIGRQISKGELILGPAQQKELQGIDADIAALPNNTTLNDEQKQEVMDKYRQRRSSVLRQAQPRPEQEVPPISSQFQEEVYWDEKGTPWTRNQHGVLQVPGGWRPPEDTAVKQQDQIDKDVNEARSLLTKKAGDLGEPPTDEAILKEAEHIRKLREKGRKKLGSSAKQPASPPTADDRDTIAPQGDALRLSGPAQPTMGGSITQPKSKEEYDALPSGAEYIDPTGEKRTKR